MAVGMEGLGRLFDASVDIGPVDLSTGANTGLRVSMRNSTCMTVLVFKAAAASGTGDPALTIKSYTASSAGSTDTTTVVVDHYYKKAAATYAITTAWTKVAITATATPTLSSEATNAGLYAFEIRAAQLPDGYPFLSVDIAKASTVAQLGGVLYIPHDLEFQRTPANLPTQSV